MYTFTLTCCPKQPQKAKLIGVGAVCILFGMCIGFALMLFPLERFLKDEFKIQYRQADRNLDILIGDTTDLRHAIRAVKDMLVSNRSAEATAPASTPTKLQWTNDDEKLLILAFALGSIVLAFATAYIAAGVSYCTSRDGPLAHWLRGGYTAIDPMLTRPDVDLKGDCQLGCSFYIKGQRREAIPCIYVPELGAWMNCTPPTPMLGRTPRRDKYDRTISGAGLVEWVWNPWANDWCCVYVTPILIGDTTNATRVEFNSDTTTALKNAVGPMRDYSDKQGLTSTVDPNKPYTIGYDAKNQAFCRILVKVKRAAPHERMY